jgi:hypothetical protein
MPGMAVHWFESRIMLKWLIKRDDPVLYARFKEYGRGRLKLLKLHLEDYQDSLDDPPEDLIQQIKYLEMLVNQDIAEEWTPRELRHSFVSLLSAHDIPIENISRLVCHTNTVVAIAHHCIWIKATRCEASTPRAAPPRRDTWQDHARRTRE